MEIRDPAFKGLTACCISTTSYLALSLKPNSVSTVPWCWKVIRSDRGPMSVANRSFSKEESILHNVWIYYREKGRKTGLSVTDCALGILGFLLAENVSNRSEWNDAPLSASLSIAEWLLTLFCEAKNDYCRFSNGNFWICDGTPESNRKSFHLISRRLL